MSAALPPDRIRAHLEQRGAVAGDIHAVADTAWDLLGAGLLDLPLPGGGQTIMRWWGLVEIAAVDLAVARVVENHLEAQAIHAELGLPLPDGLWAVWADDGQDSHLFAEATDDAWRLRGMKSWCVGARSVTTALVTAASAEGVRLFTLPTRHPGVVFDPDSGPSVGMALADPLRMTVEEVELPAGAQLAGPSWYADRPGFWATVGGNAAVWYGGALGIARAVRATVGELQTDPFGLAHLGFIDAICSSMEAMLGRAARAIDSGDAAMARTTAWQLRAGVEHLAATLVRDASQVLGADALAADESLSRRLADLSVDLRRHGGEREYAALGADVIDAGRLL